MSQQDQETSCLELFNFCLACSAVINKDDLLATINLRLINLIDFQDVAIILNNSDQQSCSTFIHHSIIDRDTHGNYLPLVNNKFIINDGFFNLIMADDSPVLWDLEKIPVNGNASPFVTYIKGLGLKSILNMALRYNGVAIGTLMLLSEFENAFSVSQFDLFKQINKQIAVTVSNIRSHTEKDILLKISNDFSEVENKNELISILHERLKDEVYFNHISISTIDELSQTYTGYIFDLKSISRKHPDFIRAFKAKYSLNNSLLGPVFNSDGPIVLKLNNPDLPQWLKVEAENGFKECVISVLRFHKKIIGFFTLFANREGVYPDTQCHILSGIVCPLSNAIVNTQKKDQVVEQEREKTQLLTFSNEIATIRDKADLNVVINHAIRHLNLFHDYVIMSVDESSQYLETYIFEEEEQSESVSILKGTTKYIADGIYEEILNSEIPVLFDIDEIAKSGNIPPNIALWEKAGATYVVAAALRNRGGVLGVIWIDPVSINLEFLKAVCSQISITLLNITSNEQIKSQLQEINKYKQQLEIEKLYLQEEIETTHNYSEIVGSSGSMQGIFKLVAKVSATQSSVLIMGETGTGKELIARAVHNASPRKNKLMIKINCAALPPNIIESELFGHEKGSFTGAVERRIGKFELAHNSTLFLDEVGELPLDLQVKLLRALQEKEIERIGGRTVIKTDVRIITATNRDLFKEVQKGNFRSDLYFRLNVFPIIIPPLRDRKEDIPGLASHFLKKYTPKGIRGIMVFSSKVVKQLTAYNWPGNVRELEHLIERTVVLTPGLIINQINLPIAGDDDANNQLNVGHVKTIDEVEREHIMKVLKLCKGKVAGIGGAAQVLKIPSTTLNSKIRRLNIKKGYQALK
jgi:formate hydrogenlyase transcriptional activator